VSRSHYALVPFPRCHTGEHVFSGGQLKGMVCHEHDIQSLTSRFEKLPFRFQGAIARQYAKQYKKKGRRKANLLVVDSLNRLPKTAYRLAADDGELRSFAKAKAESVRRAIALSRGNYDPIAFVRDIEKRYSIKMPKITLSNEVTIEGNVERLKDQQFWRRAIRKSQGRTVEQAARDFDLVHKRAGIYSSDETLYRRKGQKRRNRQMLEEVLAFNDQGDEYTLAELSDLGTSNPEIRRGELMMRIAGFDQVSLMAGHARDFWTLTCPSHFHSHHEASSDRNAKYTGVTPRGGQEYLSKVWSRLRSKLDRMGIKLYGFRICEPHHDGCPHWHLLVFVEAKYSQLVRQYFKDYALGIIRPKWKYGKKGWYVQAGTGVCWLEGVGGEPGADEKRCEWEYIREGKSAAGYVAKYISKNIEGHSVDRDLLGDDINKGMERVDAWAACWGIRQFQQIGGPPVTVWREVRRIADQEHSGILEKVTVCANGPDWAGFVQAMGGPTVKRSDLPIRPAYMQEIKAESGELPVNKYGELAAGRIVGVRQMLGQVGGLYLNQIYHQTRWNNWRFEHVTQKDTGDGCGGCAAKGQRVNTNGSGGDIELYSRGLVIDGSNRGAMADIGRLQKGELQGSGIAFKWDQQNEGKPDSVPWGCRGVWFGNPVNWKKSTGQASAAPWSSVNNCTGSELEPLMYDYDDLHQYQQLAARPPD